MYCNRVARYFQIQEYNEPMILRLPQLFNRPSWLEQQQNTILSAALVITAFNVVSAISGLIKYRVFIANFYDTAFASHRALDALIIGSQIPELIFQLFIFGAVSAAFIPAFIEYRKISEVDAFKMTRSVMTLLLLVFVLLSIPVFIFAEPLTRLRTGSDFTPEQIKIVVNLTRITLVSNFLFAVSSFYGALLQSYQRFVIPALAPVLYNLGILLGVIILAPYLGIYSAAVGMVIGAFFHMAIQVPTARKLGFRFRPSFDFQLAGVKRIVKLMPARILSISVGEFRDLSLSFFASSIGSSSMLIMQLALSVMTAPIRFFGVPISQAALPFFSEEVAKNDTEKFKELVVQSLNQISFLILPASVLILILRIPIVRLLFGTANFPWPVTVTTGWAVAIIAISIASQALVQLLVRAFYALKDTRTPFVIAIVDIIFYLAISVLCTFVFKVGVLGLAFATSATAIVEFTLNLYFLDRKIHSFRQKRFILPQVKMLSASFLMAVFLYLPFRILDEVVFDTTRTIELIALTMVTGTIGMLVYIFFAALFEIKELAFFTQLLTKFGPWRKTLGETPEVLVEATSEPDSV